MSQLPTPSLITELEVRQDEALQSLSELEERIASVLAEFGVTPKGAKSLQPSAGVALEAPQAEVELKIHQPEDQQAVVEDSDSAAA